ncbi:MAG: hypothetical protein ACI4QA_00580 [Candidatus Spyradosoma sp.]
METFKTMGLSLRNVMAKSSRPSPGAAGWKKKFKDIYFDKETTSDAREAFDRDYPDFFSKK